MLWPTTVENGASGTWGSSRRRTIVRQHEERAERSWLRHAAHVVRNQEWREGGKGGGATVLILLVLSTREKRNTKSRSYAKVSAVLRVTVPNSGTCKRATRHVVLVWYQQYQALVPYTEMFNTCTTYVILVEVEV